MHTGRSDNVAPVEYHRPGPQEVVAVYADIVAMLVITNSQPGCVRVVGRTVQNTITCPANIYRRLLVFIDSAKGDKAFIYGDPSLVLFRQRGEVKKKEEATSQATSQKALKVEVPE